MRQLEHGSLDYTWFYWIIITGSLVHALCLHDSNLFVLKRFWAALLRMTSKEVSRIEVQLLRSTKGEVIFMEVDSDFVELLFKIMKSPIAELLGACRPEDEHEEPHHAMLSLHKSLGRLGAKTFLAGCQGDALPKIPSIGQIYNGHSGSHANKDLLKETVKFMVTDSLEVFEASTVKAMELMKAEVRDFQDIITTTMTLTETLVKKLILHSMMGGKHVLTDLFPVDSDASTSEFEQVNPDAWYPIISDQFHRFNLLVSWHLSQPFVPHAFPSWHLSGKLFAWSTQTLGGLYAVHF